jgi:hypothetical protein
VTEPAAVEEELCVEPVLREPLRTRLAKLWKRWIPPMPPATPQTFKTSIRLAFYEGLILIAVGLASGPILGRLSDILALGVILTAASAGLWGLLATFKSPSAGPADDSQVKQLGTQNSGTDMAHPPAA